MKERLYISLGAVCLVLGLALSLPSILPELLATPPGVATTSTPSIVSTETPRISGAPTHIAFPRLNVSVGVVPGYYNATTQTWTVSKDTAQFATITSEPNNKSGNTFIYGHNRWQVFTALLSAKLGDEAIVTTANGHTFTYVLHSITDAQPTDTHFLGDSKDPILTVQTCSGIHYENRRMLVFQLKEVA